MKTRTSFELSYYGIVRCNCGSMTDFAEDLNEFIVPILSGTIRVEFNRVTIVVDCQDNADTIRKKFQCVMCG